MKYALNTNTESGQPDAEDAKVTQRTQKGRKEIQNYFLRIFFFCINFAILFVSISSFLFVLIFGFLLRPLRNFCVLCVRKFSPSSLRAASPL